MKRYPYLLGDACNIPLQDGQVAIVDAADYPLVSDRTWSLTKAGYVTTVISQGDGSCRWVLLHRRIMGESASLVDHIDRDRLNNRRSNLRLATRQGNSANSRTKRFLPKGVYRKYLKYRAMITVNYKSIGLGSFATVEEAAIAYDRAAKHHFGEFARTNTTIA